MMMPQTPAAASRQPTMMRMTSFRRPLGSVGVWICAVCEDAEEDVWLLVLEDAGALEEEDTLDEAGSLDALDALDELDTTPVAGMYSVRSCLPQTAQLYALRPTAFSVGFVTTRPPSSVCSVESVRALHTVQVCQCVVSSERHTSPGVWGA